MSRELDIAVAESLGKNIMRWSNYPEREPVILVLGRKGETIISKPVLYYSSDGNAMLELDREMRERGWDYINTHYSNIGDRSKFYTEMRICDPTCPDQKWCKETGLICADTEPLARALAAYKALTGAEWEGE